MAKIWTKEELSKWKRSERLHDIKLNNIKEPIRSSLNG